MIEQKDQVGCQEKNPRYANSICSLNHVARAGLLESFHELLNFRSNRKLLFGHVFAFSFIYYPLVHSFSILIQVLLVTG